MIFFMIFMQLIFPINILVRKFIHTDILTLVFQIAI